MSQWRRRDILRLLATAGVAPLLPNLWACGGNERLTVDSRRPALAQDELRDLLKETLTGLSRRHAESSALAVIDHQGQAQVDDEGSRVVRNRRGWVVFRCRSGKTWFESATNVLSPDSIRQAARTLLDRKSDGHAQGPILFGAPTRVSPQLSDDPRSQKDSEWLAIARGVHSDAASIGGSQTVYRSAELAISDRDVLFLGHGRDLFERRLRTMASAQFVAATGRIPSSARHTLWRRDGVKNLAMQSSSLELASERALSGLTARPAPAGVFNVVLAPDTAAHLLLHCIAPCVLGGEEMSINPLLTITDDPTLSDGLGSGAFDDSGQRSNRKSIAADGTLRPLSTMGTGNLRRASPERALAPAMSNIALEPGKTALRELYREADDGLFVDGAISARVDPRTWTYCLRAPRARAIRNGALGGRLYGNLSLVGDLSELLGEVRNLGDVIDRQFSLAPYVSASSPALLTRATVIPS